MDTFHKITRIPLEQEERKKLQNGFIVIPIFATLFGSALVFFWTHVGGYQGPIFWVLLFISLLIIGLFSWITIALVLDLDSGTKTVFHGLITNKERKRRRSNRKHRSACYLFFGDHRMAVEQYLYTRFEVGDLVEIHKAHYSYNVIFKTEILKRELSVP